MSFLRKSLSDPTVNGKLARAYDIHQYEHYQVHKSQLFRGKRVIGWQRYIVRPNKISASM